MHILSSFSIAGWPAPIRDDAAFEVIDWMLCTWLMIACVLAGIPEDAQTRGGAVPLLFLLRTLQPTSQGISGMSHLTIITHGLLSTCFSAQMSHLSPPLSLSGSHTSKAFQCLLCCLDLMPDCQVVSAAIHCDCKAGQQGNGSNCLNPCCTALHECMYIEAAAAAAACVAALCRLCTPSNTSG